MDYPNGQRTDYSYFPNVGSAGNGNQGDRRLSQIRHRKPGGAELSQSDYTYTPSGIIQTWSQQRDTDPATLWTLGYDAADQLTAAQVSTNGTAAPSYSYSYDLGSNRTQEQTPENLIFAAHNELNQVTGIAPTAQTTPVHLSGTVDQASIVTANGQPATDGLPANNFAIDLPLAPGASTVTLSATTPALDGKTSTQHYAVSVGNRTTVESLTYDRAGNLTSDQGGTVGAETTYAWDAANRLVKISKPGAVTEFLYDGQSRRIGEKYNGTLIKQWLWFPNAAQPAEERDANNNVTKRFYPSQGEQQIAIINNQSSTLNLFYTTDHLGSIREMTDSTGAVRARYSYDPYGRFTKQSGDLESTSGYTGFYNHTSSGLNLALYRAYSPRLGRFISRDPIEEEGGVNLYGYVFNNPLNKIDTLGLQACPLDPSNLVGGVLQSHVDEINKMIAEMNAWHSSGNKLFDITVSKAVTINEAYDLLKRSDVAIILAHGTVDSRGWPMLFFKDGSTNTSGFRNVAKGMGADLTVAACGNTRDGNVLGGPNNPAVWSQASWFSVARDKLKSLQDVRKNGRPLVISIIQGPR